MRKKCISYRLNNLVYTNPKLNCKLINIAENLESVRRLAGFGRAEKTYRCIKKQQKRKK